MPLSNWPPPAGSFPIWPPPEFQTDWLSFATLRDLLIELRKHGFTQAAPTSAETTTFFRNVRCDEGHQIIGRMLVSADGTRRYPFAACNNSDHRQLLVLWGPDYCCGGGSGLE